MNAHKKSKLDGFRKQLEEWLTPIYEGGQGLDQIQARAELAKLGCSVSPSRLSAWWSARRAEIAEDKLMGQIRSGAATVKKVTAEFEDNPPPSVEVLIGLLRVLIMKFSAQANVQPEMIDVLGTLLKPVMEHFKESGKREDRALARTKFQRETCALFVKWVANEEAKAVALGSGDNSGKIEQLGRLMFGEDWEEPKSA